MEFRELVIPGVFEIQLDPKVDDRGFFVRVYDKDIFKRRGLPTEWTQESMALTKNKGTIRGLHFIYPPYNEAKLITMLGGEAFWVFVDIRKNSPTFGKWEVLVMSAEKKNMLFLPNGIANGICTLSDDCLVSYHMDINYHEEAISGFKWDDPELNICWPIKNPTVISPRDQNAHSFREFLEKSGGGLVV